MMDTNLSEEQAKEKIFEEQAKKEINNFTIVNKALLTKGLVYFYS